MRTAPRVTWSTRSSSRPRSPRPGRADAYKCAKLALTGVAKVDTDDAEEARFRKWFGNPTPERVADVTRGLQKMRDTFKLSKVTIVNRVDIHVHMINGRDPFGDMVPTSVSGSGVYGYV